MLSGQDNAQVLLGTVTDIDLTRRKVTSHVLGRETTTSYDSLIVAAGAAQSYFGNDHFAEFAPGMKTIDDALELRGRIFGAFEMAELGANRGENVDPLLTFVVVGAGPTGVEMAGQIAELAHRTLRRDFRAINSRPARVILLDAAPQVLPPFGAKLGARAKRSSRGSASRWCSARWSPTSTRAPSPCSTRTGAPSGSRPRPRSGPPACRPPRWAGPCRSRPARRSTGPAGSPSTPTSRCPATPRCSWSAT